MEWPFQTAPSARVKVISAHLLVLLGLLAANNTLSAGSSASANYTILHQTFDFGGGRATTANYTADISLGGFGGLTETAASGVNIRLGYAGQLIDVTPVLTAIVPDEAVGGAGDLTLTLEGSDFAPNAVVRWNGAPRDTAFLSSSQLSALIPASDLPDLLGVVVALVTVENPGVGVSEPKPFTLKAANVRSVQTAVAPPGQTVVVQATPTAPDQAGLSASFSHQSPGSPSATVTTAAYTSNPVAGTTIDTGGGVVDLQITGADASDSATVNFYYSTAITDVAEAALVLRFYNGSAWVNLLGSGGATPANEPADNLDGTESGGRFAVVFDNTSTPRITELSGTFIAMSVNAVPVARCQNVTVIAEGDCSAPAIIDDGSFDPDGDTITLAQNPPGPYPIGKTVVTLTVTDFHGASTSCTAIVTAIENVPPSLTVPAPIVVSNDPGKCDAIVLFLVTATDNCPGVTVVSTPPSGSTFPKGTTTVTSVATDAGGNKTSKTFTITVTPRNAPPTLSIAQATVTVNEGSTASNTGTWSDADGNAVTVSASVGTITVQANAWSWSYAAADGAADSQTVTITANDGQGGTATVNFQLIVNNVAPSVAIVGPASGFLSAVDAPIAFSATFVDPGSQDTHTAHWSFTSAALPQTDVPAVASGGTVAKSFQFAEPGVYNVTLTVTDKDGGAGQATTVADNLPAYVVVYDPNGGFVTGGGWIYSPPGAMHPDLNAFAEGKATFGFVSQYHHGATVPDGNTEFQFKAGGLKFKSTAYEWLVVSGARAQYKGSGRINGAGDYRFMLTAIDGQINGGGGNDRFRIKIWDQASGAIIYDNQRGGDDNAALNTIIGGGSIVIHKFARSCSSPLTSLPALRSRRMNGTANLRERWFPSSNPRTR